MPGQRHYGMDHEYYDWSPIVKRRALTWPGDARVALCVIVNLEHLEWKPPQGSYQSPTLAGGWGRQAFPDYSRFSERQYGLRIGIFRVLDVLAEHGIRATVAMDALTAENYPYLVDHCLDRGCEIIGHGISVNRMITSDMSEQEEKEYIQTSVQALKRATGSAPLGWLGPEQGESSRTPRLLAEAGFRYVCDWSNDEQPYLMQGPRGELVALPVMLSMDDVDVLWERRVPRDRYPKMLKEGFDTMYRDGARIRRLLVLNLHPWLIGQPFRIGYLDNALRGIMRRRKIWAATGSEIVEWFLHDSTRAEG